MWRTVVAATVLSAGAVWLLFSERQDGQVDIVIVAPHPDDEILMAGGTLANALAEGKRAAVLIVTNGDYTCARDGARRIRESVAALTSLGLPESSIHFLGYPDGFLNALTEVPFSVERRTSAGECVRADATWADRGFSRVEAHRARSGVPAPFVESAVVGDLAGLLAVLNPTDIYLPHERDAHPDHAKTNALVKMALGAVEKRERMLHKSLVHVAKSCWPGDCTSPFHPAVTMPEPPAPFARQETQRVRVNAVLKAALLRRHASQINADFERDWMSGFVRRDELFFLEPVGKSAPVVAR
jgi:LmbE family N-acetylglucosaminyl deacetylase